MASRKLDSQLIHAAYDTLGLQSYLTAGEKEVRVRTPLAMWLTVRAAGVIFRFLERDLLPHRSLIFNDLVAAGSEACSWKRRNSHRRKNPTSCSQMTSLTLGLTFSYQFCAQDCPLLPATSLSFLSKTTKYFLLQSSKLTKNLSTDFNNSLY